MRAFIESVAGAAPDRRGRARPAPPLAQACARCSPGRTGGMLIEAIAGVDIALWDIAGNAPACRSRKLLGGMGRTQIDAYASSINWLDDATVEAEVARALAAGFRQIKVKIGSPAADAIERARFVRRLVGDGIGLSVDANWAYDVDDASAGSAACSPISTTIWFEEPIRPEDRRGYRMLREKLPIRLAAGESDFCAADAVGADRGPLARPDPAGRGPLRRHHRNLAHRRTRAKLRRRLRAACGLVRRDLRRRKPAIGGRGGELPRLRMHGLRQTPAAEAALTSRSATGDHDATAVCRSRTAQASEIAVDHDAAG